MPAVTRDGGPARKTCRRGTPADVAVRIHPRKVGFPNLDLTAHFFNGPLGEWIGFETAVSFGPAGIGLTHSIVHDRTGPIGAVSQILTVRPGAGAI